MKCEEARERLDDYVDGAVSEKELHEIELHLHGCGGCSAEERDLRRVVALAANLPRSLEPPRDLWPQIAAGLDREGAGWRLPARRAAPWLGALAAAAAIVIALRVAPGAPGSPPPTVLPAAAVAPVELQEAEREYARAAAELLALLQQRADSLPPGTVAAVEDNVRRIDAALAEVRAALAEDPANPRLGHLLTATHEKKLDALRRVVRLTTPL